MITMPFVRKPVCVQDSEASVLVPQNSVQIYDKESRRFIPLSEAFDVSGTLETSVDEGTVDPEIVMDILSGWRDWYRVPTEQAVKQIFPDSEVTEQDGSKRVVSNVAQVKSDSRWYIRYRVRTWVNGRRDPAVMVLPFPALYQGAFYVTDSGSVRVWRDLVMPDGKIVRSLGAVILQDLIQRRADLLRRAEYLSDEQLQARWQQRINRVASTLYSKASDTADMDITSDYALEAVRHTIRLIESEDTMTSAGETLPRARLEDTARQVAGLLQAGEIADPLHTPSGSPCAMFYRPWSEHSEDGEPIQLWKHPLSKMVNPGRVGVLAGDIHCLPLAKGSLHRIKVEGFPYYDSVYTRDLLGVACDLPYVLGDGFVISEKAAEELSVVISDERTLTADELINLRVSSRDLSCGTSRLRGRKPIPMTLPSPGGEERRWRVRLEDRVRRIRVGDKLQSGTIKGVVNRILPVEEMPKVIRPVDSVQPADIIFSWRHWQKWGVLSEIGCAQLAYWCGSDDAPFIVKHGELSDLQDVQALVESAGGSPDLTLPVLFLGETEPQRVYAGYFPVGVREQLVEVQSQESHMDPQRMRRAVEDPLIDPLAYLLAPDKVSGKGVRLGYADIFCLMDDYPEMTEWLLGFSNDFRLRELAALFVPESG